jgi:TRAP-type C4-dicarboxylate transport system substrate-binding protein
MFEVQDAVVGGTLDLAKDNGGFWIGRGLQVGGVEFSLPYSYFIPEKATFTDKANEIRRFYFEDGLVDILRAEYAKQGVYWLDMNSYGPVPFLIGTKKAADAFQGTANDIKSLIIRTDGLWMEWHNKMGMTGIDISQGDAYIGLQTGSIDCNIWDVSIYVSMHYEDVAPYWIRGEENDHAIGHIVVNMDVWNSLSPTQQDALTKAGEVYWTKLLADYDNAMKDVRAMVDAGTVIEVQMSDAVRAWHEEVAYALWDDVAGWDEACAQAVQLIKRWRGVE